MITQAYRDEGMSYRYAPPSDFIDIKNSRAMAEIFKKLKIPYVSENFQIYHLCFSILQYMTRKNEFVRKVLH